ncbi:MAG: RNB domain-containing ribonuclease, partial [Planctomycetota bacterium]
LTQFARMATAYGLDVEEDLTDRFALQRLLDRIGEEPDEARMVLNYLCLRCFQKAIYSIQNTGHHALAFRHYCHFTSPIRRYPDLLVHRVVKHELGLINDDVSLIEDHLDALARQSSFLEQRAEMAERDLHDIKAARYLQRRLGDTFAAVITIPTAKGLQVRLLETGLEGFVPVRDLGTDWFDYDGDRLALVGRSTGTAYGIGGLCEVQVVDTDIPRGQVTLRLVGAQPAPGTVTDLASR